MRKQIKKLKLHRETVRNLTEDRLVEIAGASGATVCRTCPGDPTCAPCKPTVLSACC